MDLSTAIGVMGLAWDFTRDDVLKAYKRCMLQSHPDKNPDPASTARAQRINEAKDYLMGRAYFAESERKEAKQRWEEQEVENDIKKVRDWLQEMELATEEAKQRFENWFKATHELYRSHPSRRGYGDWYEVFREYHDKRKALQRRQRYNANLKKKRPEGSRAHRKDVWVQGGQGHIGAGGRILARKHQGVGGVAPDGLGRPQEVCGDQNRRYCAGAEPLQPPLQEAAAGPVSWGILLPFQAAAVVCRGCVEIKT